MPNELILLFHRERSGRCPISDLKDDFSLDPFSYSSRFPYQRHQSSLAGEYVCVCVFVVNRSITKKTARSDRLDNIDLAQSKYLEVLQKERRKTIVRNQQAGIQKERKNSSHCMTVINVELLKYINLLTSPVGSATAIDRGSFVGNTKPRPKSRSSPKALTRFNPLVGNRVPFAYQSSHFCSWSIQYCHNASQP